MPFLDDIRKIKAYNIGGPKKGYWLVDFISIQTCATQYPFHHLQYNYDGLGFRGPAEWTDGNFSYLTSEGKTKEDENFTRSRWCDASGFANDKWAGLTIFSHPENFRHPEPMRIWPYKLGTGRVFFGFSPSRIGPWTMTPGKKYIFKYRLFLHDEKIDPAEANRIFNDFAHPAKVKIQ